MSQPSRTTLYLLLLPGVLLLPACAAKAREPAVAAQSPGHDAAFGSTQQTSEPRTTDPARSSDRGDEASTEIYADVELLATCGMEAPTVYFEYDSANVRRAAQVELTALAECMQRPPLADRKLEVIGHADERGTEQYNEGLGLRRATAVTDQLIAHGLDRTRVQARSHGEEEASDPPEWTDRRVVIRLQDDPTQGSKQEQSE